MINDFLQPQFSIAKTLIKIIHFYDFGNLFFNTFCNSFDMFTEYILYIYSLKMKLKNFSLSEL